MEKTKKISKKPVSYVSSSDSNDSCEKIKKIPKYKKTCVTSQNEKVFSSESEDSINSNKKSDYSEDTDSEEDIKGVLQKINHGEDHSLDIVSVIITIYSGSSYDKLLRSVPQKPSYGRVSLYALDLNHVEMVYKYLNNQMSDAACQSDALRTNLKKLKEEIEELEKNCILFNFECCSGCENISELYKFPNHEKVFQFIKYSLEMGYMIMISDYAVRALIKNWDETLLGPNPFYEKGGCNFQMSIKFKPDKLKQCKSVQLQMVGKLSEKGAAHIRAYRDTIVIGLNQQKISKAHENEIYQLTTLSCVYSAKCLFSKAFCDKKSLIQIEDKEGTVGHAILKYKNDGCMMISAGHWAELQQLDVSLERLEKISKDVYGNEYDEEIIKIKNIKDAKLKEKKANQLANRFVQQSAPCNSSEKRK